MSRPLNLWPLLSIAVSANPLLRLIRSESISSCSFNQDKVEEEGSARRTNDIAVTEGPALHISKSVFFFVKFWLIFSGLEKRGAYEGMLPAPKA